MDKAERWFRWYMVGVTVTIAVEVLVLLAILAAR